MQPIETGSATVELAISGLTGFQDFQDRFLRLIGLFSYSVNSKMISLRSLVCVSVNSDSETYFFYSTH